MAFGGGLLRGRFRYLQGGFFLETAERTGTTPIGGVAFGLMLTAGFDVCACKGER